MIWTCVDHDGHYPVGVASVVVAATESDARALLDAALKTEGLVPDDYTLERISADEPCAYVLNNGDY